MNILIGSSNKGGVIVTKKKLESYIGKEVKVILFDDTELKGTLRKGKTPLENTYTLLDSENENWFFRASHIKKLEVLK